jgi:hypothetical protein
LRPKEVSVRVQFIERQNGPERLVCEGEIVFDEDGPLAGIKLTGFSIWRGQEGEPFVTFPARSFGAGGERRFFDLLRAVEPGSEEPKRVKDWIVSEYRQSVNA